MDWTALELCIYYIYKQTKIYIYIYLNIYIYSPLLGAGRSVGAILLAKREAIDN